MARMSAGAAALPAAGLLEEPESLFGACPDFWEMLPPSAAEVGPVLLVPLVFDYRDASAKTSNWI